MIIRASEVPDIGKSCRSRPIVFCSGSFDLLHPGHLWFFKMARRIIKADATVLVVAVGSDAIIAYRKFGRPIIDEEARLAMVNSLRDVDFCYLDTITTEESILGGIEHAFAFLKPDAYVIEHDAFNIGDRYALCERYGVKIHILNKAESEFPEMSTTAIIEKICERQKR